MQLLRTTGKNNRFPLLDIPNQGTWLGIPWLGLVSLCQIWDFYGYSLNTLKYPIMGICYFFLWTWMSLFPGLWCISLLMTNCCKKKTNKQTTTADPNRTQNKFCLCFVRSHDSAFIFPSFNVFEWGVLKKVVSFENSHWTAWSNL